MSVKEKKVLVTGGTGFIGTNVCRELMAMGGYEVVSFSNEDPHSILAGVTYLKGDVTNFNEVRDAVDDNEVVINLAALLGVFRSIENPDSYVDVNIKGTVNVLKAAAAQGSQVRRFIQASSDALYGEYPLVEGGISEDYCPLTPLIHTRFQN